MISRQHGHVLFGGGRFPGFHIGSWSWLTPTAEAMAPPAAPLEEECEPDVILSGT